jgi:hypothetical protein
LGRNACTIATDFSIMETECIISIQKRLQWFPGAAIAHTHTTSKFEAALLQCQIDVVLESLIETIGIMCS